VVEFFKFLQQYLTLPRTKDVRRTPLTGNPSCPFKPLFNTHGNTYAKEGYKIDSLGPHWEGKVLEEVPTIRMDQEHEVEEFYFMKEEEDDDEGSSEKSNGNGHLHQPKEEKFET